MLVEVAFLGSPIVVAQPTSGSHWLCIVVVWSLLVWAYRIAKVWCVLQPSPRHTRGKIKETKWFVLRSDGGFVAKSVSVLGVEFLAVWCCRFQFRCSDFGNSVCSVSVSGAVTLELLFG